MLVTEEQAKEMWCPAARVSNTGAGNRYPMTHDLAHNHAFSRCIASKCMWWRWELILEQERHLKVGKEPEPDAKSKGWTTPTTTVMGYVVWRLKKQPERGFCGIAGKP